MHASRVGDADSGGVLCMCGVTVAVKGADSSVVL